MRVKYPYLKDLKMMYVKSPATRGFLRLGSPFFADFLWRGKESQRGALPHSATASRGIPWVKVSAQTLAIPIVKVSQGTCHEVVYPRTFQRGCSGPRVNRASPGRCSEVLYPRRFRDISPTGGELEKREAGSVGASPKRSGLKPLYLWLLRAPYPEALYL